MTSLPLGVKVEDSAFGQAPGATATATASATMGADDDGPKPKAAPSLLPFSVEALMADHRKPGAKDGVPAAGESARPAALCAPDAPASPRPLGPFSVGGLLQLPEDALVKAESPERAERTPWMQNPRFSPPPARK